MDQEQGTIDLQELFGAIFRNIILIVLITSLFGLIAALVTSYGIDKKYKSETLFTVQTYSEVGDTPSSENFRVGSELAKRYSIIAKSNTVIEAVRVDLATNHNLVLSPGTIRNSFNVVSVNETDILRISVIYTDHKDAQKIAQTVTDVSMKVYEEKYSGVRVESIDPADLNEGHVSPNEKLNMIIGTVIGFMISIGVVLMKEFLNRTIKTEKDIEQYLNIPYFGSIPDMNKAKNL